MQLEHVLWKKEKKNDDVTSLTIDSGPPECHYTLSTPHSCRRLRCATVKLQGCQKLSYMLDQDLCEINSINLLWKMLKRLQHWGCWHLRCVRIGGRQCEIVEGSGGGEMSGGEVI